MSEMIACVPAAHVDEQGQFQGFQPDYARYLHLLANPEFRPRDELEEDSSWKQLIPYMVLYQRYKPIKLGPSGSGIRVPPPVVKYC